MKKVAKNYKKKLESYDSKKVYEAKEAIQVVKKNATAKFDETVELHIRTGCDSKYAEQQIRGSVVLPAGTGKKVKILVFAKDAKADEAKAAGADYVGVDEYVQKIQSEGWLDFDAVVATPDLMGTVGKLAKILGPKGLMPNPKTGTVTADVTKIIEELKAGKVEYRLDKQNLIHCPLGKASFSEDKLEQNLDALMNAIVKARPQSLKGTFLKSITISSTMGPGIKLNTLKYTV